METKDRKTRQENKIGKKEKVIEELKIKVCGMKHLENIQAVDKLGVDYLGFIFYPKSKRDASLVSPDDLLHVKAKKVGVFVNESFEFINKKVKTYKLQTVQLHGDETPELCKLLKEQGLEIFKVFSVGESFNFKQLEPYKKHVDYFLFDTKGKERGGNGVTFDWSLLESYDNEVPVILSGGLNSDNVESAKSIKKLKLYALDLNSGFEVEPGLKDVKLLEKSLKK